MRHPSRTKNIYPDRRMAPSSDIQVSKPFLSVPLLNKPISNMKTINGLKDRTDLLSSYFVLQLDVPV